MNKRFLLPLAVLAGAATFGLTACTDDAKSTDPTSAPDDTTQAIGPVMADVTTK